MNNFNQKKVNRHIDYIDNKIREYQEQLDQGDQKFNSIEIKAKIDYQNSKKDKYRHIEKTITRVWCFSISI